MHKHTAPASVSAFRASFGFQFSLTKLNPCSIYAEAYWLAELRDGVAVVATGTGFTRARAVRTLRKTLNQG